jgi:hypothetical protein
VLGIDVAGARPEPARDCEKVSHDVGGRLPGCGRQAVELNPPGPAIWPFLDLPHVQGRQDPMGESPDRDVVGSASRCRDGGRDVPEPISKRLTGDPRAEQVLEFLRCSMRPCHVGQLSKLIEVIRAAAARRQPKEQPPRRDQFRLSIAGRDRRRHDLDEFGIACGVPDAPLHLDLNGRRDGRRVGMPPDDDVIERIALVTLLECDLGDWPVNTDRDTGTSQESTHKIAATSYSKMTPAPPVEADCTRLREPSVSLRLHDDGTAPDRPPRQVTAAQVIGAAPW